MNRKGKEIYLKDVKDQEIFFWKKLIFLNKFFEEEIWKSCN